MATQKQLTQQAQTGAGTNTVTSAIAARHNVTAAPEDQVNPEALTQRVRYEAGQKCQSDTIETEALELRKDIKKTTVIAIQHNLGDNESNTPIKYIKAARKVMGSHCCPR